MAEVLLGAETDDELFEKLCAEIRLLGGLIEDSKWVLGGSQEVRTYAISLPTGDLEAVTETYVGLTLRGPASLVEMLAHRVAPNPSSIDSPTSPSD